MLMDCPSGGKHLLEKYIAILFCFPPLSVKDQQANVNIQYNNPKLDTYTDHTDKVEISFEMVGMLITYSIQLTVSTWRGLGGRQAKPLQDIFLNLFM